MLIPHQANQRIIDSTMRGLKLEDGQVFVNLDRYGNTSSASVPIAKRSTPFTEDHSHQRQCLLTGRDPSLGLRFAHALQQLTHPRPRR